MIESSLSIYSFCRQSKAPTKAPRRYAGTHSEELGLCLDVSEQLIRQNFNLSLRGQDLMGSCLAERSREEMVVKLFSNEVKLSRKILLS